MVVGIAILLPLFLGLFVDALYSEPKYEDYCKDRAYPYVSEKMGANCSYNYGPGYDQCMQDGGIARFNYDDKGCGTFKECDMCNKDYDKAINMYNRNIFFILAPLGLIMIIAGLYLTVDYLGAGLMFGGLITLFYATIRYFSNMSKMLRAFIILVELLIIMWIGYKKITKESGKSSKGSKKKGR